jgi:hypothetical protein
VGHPIWTHEFADPDTLLELKVALMVNDEGHTYNPPRHLTPLDSLIQMIA